LATCTGFRCEVLPPGLEDWFFSIAVVGGTVTVVATTVFTASSCTAALDASQKKSETERSIAVVNKMHILHTREMFVFFFIHALAG
jgi:Mn2+/Fe2+ NRAMP family transporter